MALTHTNKIKYRYTAGGIELEKEVIKTESHGGEMSLSQQIVTSGGPKPGTETTDIDLEFFEFTTAAQAKSVYLRLDGFNAELYANGSAGTKMIDLEDGEPFVWSYNDGIDYPPGNSNVMKDSTTKLTVQPDVGAGTDTTGTIEVRVLYNPLD